MNKWNSLPSKIVEAPNLKIFERRLDRHWRQHDLKYSFRGVVNCSPLLTNGRRLARLTQRKRELQMIWIYRPCGLHPITLSTSTSRKEAYLNQLVGMAVMVLTEGKAVLYHTINTTNLKFTI